MKITNVEHEDGVGDVLRIHVILDAEEASLLCRLLHGSSLAYLDELALRGRHIGREVCSTLIRALHEAPDDPSPQTP